MTPLRHRYAGPMGEDLRRRRAGVSLYWLGQAGFVVAVGERRILVDPYLSDHLARKYAGRRYAHQRMMAPPISVAEFDRIDWILCTHRHGDHMDPLFLPAALARFTDAKVVVPAADLAQARSIGLPPTRTIGVTAGGRIDLGDGIAALVLPAAHEDRERDEHGQDRFLGYVLIVGGIRLYHSGDCVPFDALDEAVSSAAPTVALLPVNGRDEVRRAAGIPGNFTLAEAIDLCRRCGIPVLVPHHFGLFSFNTIDPVEVDAAATADAAVPGEVAIMRPEIGLRYDFGSCHAA